MKGALLACLAFLCACSPLGVRGARDPNLDPDIRVGATLDRVLTVLGRPDRRFVRESQGESLEIWAYTFAVPVLAVPVTAIEAASPLAGKSVTGIRDDEALRLVFREGKVIALERRS